MVGVAVVGIPTSRRIVSAADRLMVAGVADVVVVTTLRLITSTRRRAARLGSMRREPAGRLGLQVLRLRLGQRARMGIPLRVEMVVVGAAQRLLHLPQAVRVGPAVAVAAVVAVVALGKTLAWVARVG